MMPDFRITTVFSADSGKVVVEWNDYQGEKHREEIDISVGERTGLFLTLNGTIFNMAAIRHDVQVKNALPQLLADLEESVRFQAERFAASLNEWARDRFQEVQDSPVECEASPDGTHRWERYVIRDGHFSDSRIVDAGNLCRWCEERQKHECFSSPDGPHSWDATGACKWCHITRLELLGEFATTTPFDLHKIEAAEEHNRCPSAAKGAHRWVWEDESPGTVYCRECGQVREAYISIGRWLKDDD